MIQLDDTPIMPGVGSYTYGETIDQDGIDAIVEAINYGFATAGAKHNLGTWSDPLWTISETFTQEAGASSGDNLDDYNLTIQPARAEIGGLDPAGSVSAYVLVFEVFAASIDLRVTLEGLSNGSEVGATVHQKTVSFGESTSWKRLIFVVEDDTYAAFKTKLEFMWNETEEQGDLYAATLEEMRYVNLAHSETPSLEAYGSEYVGMYANGDPAEVWDADGAQRALEVISGTPTMIRDEISSGVHAVEFEGSEAYATEGFDLGAPAGIVGAIALRVETTDTVIPFTKEGPSLYATVARCYNGSYLRVDVRTWDGSSTTLSNVQSSAGSVSVGQWHDLIWWWDKARAELVVWLDGELVGTASSPSDNNLRTGSYPLYLGRYYSSSYHWEGGLAMPALIAGEFTRRQVKRFVDWRRSIHGIW